MKKFICFLFLAFAAFYGAKAQLSGYSYASPITVSNTASVSIIDYQLKLTVNTQSVIAASQMSATGDDIRFGKTCSGSALYNYWIESGINTPTTVIWVRIDTIPASGSRTFYLFSGNATVTPVSSVPLTFNGARSATDSVNTGAPGGVGNSQRGFRFSPNEDILVTDFGKDEPTGTMRYVTLFDYSSTNILAQTQVSGPAATYTYAPLSSPMWLTQGTQYVLELYQGASDGYYFGSSSQINSRLTYYDMRYCNSCTQNTFPTNTLSNYHYGYPDLLFYYKNNFSPAPTYSIGALPAVSVAQSAGTVCASSAVTFTASSASSLSYTWQPGALTGSVVTVIPASSTLYTVTGTPAGCSIVQTATAGVSVVSLPSVSVATSNSLLCVGQSATLTASGASSYTWMPSGSGTSIVVSPTATATYTATGTNTTTGCSNMATVTQSVSACTAVNNLTGAEQAFSIFPNPSNGKFSVSLDRDAQVEICNVLGETVFMQKVRKGISDINLSEMGKGTYFVKVSFDDKHAMRRIIVQ